MWTYTIVGFALAGIGGLMFSTRAQRDCLAQWAPMLSQALFAPLGLILMIALLANGNTSKAVLGGVMLMSISMLCGVCLAPFQARRKLSPKTAAVIQAGTAAAGLLTLVIALL